MLSGQRILVFFDIVPLDKAGNIGSCSGEKERFNIQIWQWLGRAISLTSYTFETINPLNCYLG